MRHLICDSLHFIFHTGHDLLGLVTFLRQAFIYQLQRVHCRTRQILHINAWVVFVEAIFEQAHRAERLRTLRAKVGLFRLMFIAIGAFVLLSPVDKLLDGSAPHKICLVYFPSTFGTLLALFEALIEAAAALDGRALWTHPDFARNHGEASITLAKRLCVDTIENIAARDVSCVAFHFFHNHLYLAKYYLLFCTMNPQDRNAFIQTLKANCGSLNSKSFCRPLLDGSVLPGCTVMLSRLLCSLPSR